MVVVMVILVDLHLPVAVHQVLVLGRRYQKDPSEDQVQVVDNNNKGKND